MSARTALAQALAAALPTYRVLGYGEIPDSVTRPTVVVWVEKIERAEQIALDRLVLTFQAWVLVGGDNPATVDDALEAALDDVIDAWQGVPWCAWTEATRGVLADKFPGYLITARAVGKIGD